MDPTKQRNVTRKRKYFPDGHLINYAVSVCKPLVFQSWPFKRTYKTECKCFPTSWDLNIEFLEVKEDATACLYFTFKRNDTEVSICVQICDSYMALIYPKLVFERVSMQPGDVLQETVETSAYPERKQAIDEGVVLHISVKIDSCHLDTDQCSSLRLLNEFEL